MKENNKEKLHNLQKEFVENKSFEEIVYFLQDRIKMGLGELEQKKSRQIKRKMLDEALKENIEQKKKENRYLREKNFALGVKLKKNKAAINKEQTKRSELRVKESAMEQKINDLKRRKFQYLQILGRNDLTYLIDGSGDPANKIRLVDPQRIKLREVAQTSLENVQLLPDTARQESTEREALSSARNLDFFARNIPAIEESFEDDIALLVGKKEDQRINEQVNETDLFKQEFNDDRKKRFNLNLQGIQK